MLATTVIEKYCLSLTHNFCVNIQIINKNVHSATHTFCIKTASTGLSFLACKNLDGFYSRCFAQLKPGDPRVKSSLPEIITRDAVYNAGFTDFIPNKVFSSNNCNCTHAYRLDCKVGNTMIAIEIDEHEHSGYSLLNDEIRYNGLMMVTGTNWVIIRFNPDRTRKE